MLVPLLIAGGIATAVFLAKKQEETVTEKPVETTEKRTVKVSVYEDYVYWNIKSPLPNTIKTLDDFMKSGYVLEGVKQLVNFSSELKTFIVNYLSKKSFTGELGISRAGISKTDGEYKIVLGRATRALMKRPVNPPPIATFNVEIVGEIKMLEMRIKKPLIPQALKAPRITSIEQALKSKWVTKEAKEMLRAKTGSEKSKEYFQAQLNNQYITAIKTSWMGGKGFGRYRFLVFERKPYQWKKMNPKKKKKIINKCGTMARLEAFRRKMETKI